MVRTANNLKFLLEDLEVLEVPAESAMTASATASSSLLGSNTKFDPTAMTSSVIGGRSRRAPLVSRG